MICAGTVRMQKRRFFYIEKSPCSDNMLYYFNGLATAKRYNSTFEFNGAKEQLEFCLKHRIHERNILSKN